MNRRPPDFTYEIQCIPHLGDDGVERFSADALIRDATGAVVKRLTGNKVHAYYAAAEDDAVDAARDELKRLRDGHDGPRPPS